MPMSVQLFQHYPFSIKSLLPLCRNQMTILTWVISRFSSFIELYIYLIPHCIYLTVLIFVALYALKLSGVIPPVLNFCQNCYILVPLPFHIHSIIKFSISMKIILGTIENMFNLLINMGRISIFTSSNLWA